MALNLRKYSFWAVDALRGSPIRSQFADIARKMRELPQRLAVQQELGFVDILNHATTTTPFYKQYGSVKQLQQLPVINKTTILDNYAQFRSSHFPGDNLKQMATSGSTGIPFRILQDPTKRHRVLADLLYHGAQVGYEVGVRHGFFRILNSDTTKKPLTLFLQNELIFDVMRQGPVQLEQQRQALLKAAPVPTLIGYVSALQALAEYVLEKGDDPEKYGVQGAICVAECLLPSARMRIEKAFNCTVISRYSNQENGILGQQLPKSDLFRLNTASFIFEFLKLDSDEPAAPNEEGRIVITDLYNKAMPVLRYDTGDTGVLTTSQRGYPALRDLAGRKVDRIWDPAGRMLSPLAFGGIFIGVSEVRQFQLVQTGVSDYTVKVTCSGATPVPQIDRAVKGILGDTAKVTVERVAEIPVLPSGKRRFIVQDYYPTSGPEMPSNSTQAA
jgi:phenylacetate-CoA ligase